MADALWKECTPADLGVSLLGIAIVALPSLLLKTAAFLRRSEPKGVRRNAVEQFGRRIRI